MVDPLALPATFDVAFPGFSRDAFAILGRLRANPVAEQYREEKEKVARTIMTPFRQFRDDLVVNVVLPNHLLLETERNVFSRLLKNDFGAGGCNSHVWMSFYRPGMGRLSDLQPFHGIDPDGFYSGLHVGGRDRALVADAKAAIRREPEASLQVVNGLLREPGWILELPRGTGAHSGIAEFHEPLNAWPDMIQRAPSISVYRSFTSEEVVDMGPDLLREAAAAMGAVWPLYRAFVDENA